MELHELLALIPIIGSAVFFLSGTVGMLRFPDTLSRVHALTKADNVGLGLLTLGLILLADSPAAAVKLIVIWVLALLASASTSSIIATHRLRAIERASE